MPNIACMDYEGLAALEEALDEIIDARVKEEECGLEGMDRTELTQLRRTVSDILDAMDEAELAAKNAEYERSV